MARLRLKSLLIPIIALPLAVRADGIVASSVALSVNVSNPNDALGNPIAAPGSNFGDDITPFTPPFENIAIVGDTNIPFQGPNNGILQVNSAAANLTLQFAAPVKTGQGRNIGIYSYAGLAANFDPQTSAITAATGPVLISSIADTAFVSVSKDGTNFFPLNGGNLLNLAMVSNQFTNSDVEFDTGGQFYTAASGSILSDPFKPFTGSLSDFSGESYSQMVTTLNGSFGGLWIDPSSSGLDQVNYIRFEVPQGANYRAIVDAVTAIPEPASLGILALGLGILAQRRWRKW
ncbi:MAG TPA: PEP-CTERM sorting domain-containing protein [Phycisphaerae bacterium]|jgi:hypothetical protein